MKLLSALLFATLGLSLSAPGMAQSTAAPKHAAKHAAKKAHVPAPAAEHTNATSTGDDDEDDLKEPEVGSSVATDFSCELGNKITIYRNVDDDKHIALRWKKQILRLHRVTTTTGANRFENRRAGWVWIDIPAKGMLLDSKQGHQLANECRNAEQLTAQSEASKK